MRLADEGERRWFYGGGTHTWKVTTQDSDGSFFLFEDELVEGKMTPWHCHPDTDELAYILEGELEVNIDGDIRRLGAGSTYMTPRGVPHAFVVVSPTARILAFQTPGTSQAFYWDASEPAIDSQDGLVDFDRIRAVAAATGATNVIGPPPFAR
jgi:quercetin dioxygenase-like cupin family protein